VKRLRAILSAIRAGLAILLIPQRYRSICIAGFAAQCNFEIGHAQSSNDGDVVKHLLKLAELAKPKDIAEIQVALLCAQDAKHITAVSIGNA
jgi:hypothetical protein